MAKPATSMLRLMKVKGQQIISGGGAARIDHHGTSTISQKQKDGTKNNCGLARTSSAHFLC